jgi:hypothetical protein
MISTASFIGMELRGWKANVDRAGTVFGALSREELQKRLRLEKQTDLPLGPSYGGERPDGRGSGIW